MLTLTLFIEYPSCNLSKNISFGNFFFNGKVGHVAYEVKALILQTVYVFMFLSILVLKLQLNTF